MTRLQAAAAAVLFVVAFGGLVPGLFMAADDCGQTVVLTGLDLRAPGLADKIWRSVWHAEGGGHFKPAQDAIFAVTFHLFGPNGWVKGTIVLYMALHFFSALLLAGIVRRLGAPRPAAFLAGLLFLLHPAVDECFACAMYAPNVPGLFFLLLAAFAWLGTVPGRGRDAIRIAGAGLALLLAMGSNLIFLVSGPILLLGMLVLFPRDGTWVRRALPRAAVVLVALGLTAWHRIDRYGTLTTRVSTYSAMTPPRNPVRFVRQLADAAILLRPSDTITDHSDPERFGSVRFPSFTVGYRIVAIAIGVIVAAFAWRWKRFFPYAAPASDAGRSGKALLFGVLLVAALSFPYFWWLDTYGYHRYSYPAVAGLAAIAGALLGALRRVRSPLVRTATSTLGAFIITAAVATMAVVDLDAASSIAEGHTIVRTVVDGAAPSIADTPQVDKVFLIGCPRVVGRAGLVFLVDDPAYSLLQALRARIWRIRKDAALLGPRARAFHELGLFQGWESGELPFPLAPDTALFAYYQHRSSGNLTRTVDRVLAVDDDALGLGTTPIIAFLARWWRLDDPGKAREKLASPEPAVARAVIRAVDNGTGRGARIVSLALEGARDPEPLGPGPVDAYAGLLTPRAQAMALDLLGERGDDDRVARARQALEAPACDPEIRAAAERVLRRAGGPDAIDLALDLATSCEDAIAAGALETAAKVADVDQNVLAAAALFERKGRLASHQEAPNAAAEFEQAAASYERLGIRRAPAILGDMRCRISGGAADDALVELSKRLERLGFKESLAAERDAFERARKGAFGPGISLAVAMPGGQGMPKAGTRGFMVAVVTNASDHALPGGDGCYAARISWRWRSLERENDVRNPGDQPLPRGGVERDRRLRIPCSVTAPGAGLYDFEVTLEAFGHPLAPAVVIPRAAISAGR